MSWGDGGREPISASAGYVTVILFTRTPFYLKTSCHVTLQLRHLIVIFVCLLRLDGRCNGCIYCFSFPKLPLSRWNVSVGIDRDVDSTLTFNFPQFPQCHCGNCGNWIPQHKGVENRCLAWGTSKPLKTNKLVLKPIQWHWQKNSDGTIAWEIRLFVS